MATFNCSSTKQYLKVLGEEKELGRVLLFAEKLGVGNITVETCTPEELAVERQARAAQVG